jgi:FkbM family methyltransferase
MSELRQEMRSRLRLLETDPKFAIEHFQTPVRDFWIKKKGADMDGRELLAYLVAEHQWVAAVSPGDTVKPGDIVIDCGAHVGVFTQSALAHGAARVIAVEPEPVNLECLRRNFAAEIASGRVILQPVGVWDSPGTMNLSIAEENSGENSMVLKPGKTAIQVPVTTIDALVNQLGISHVNYIKMDIEGAERHALRGAAHTLRSSKPRLMLDTYHLGDDPVVLPALILTLNPAYQERCGPCEGNQRGPLLSLVPHVTYYY